MAPLGWRGPSAREEATITANRIDRAELARLMAAMAEDLAMVVPFLAAYGGRLAGLVRRHLRELGRGDLAADPDTVQGLVLDVGLFLRDHAGSWRPDGALPWTWAWSAIRAIVVEEIGHARADVELERLDDGWAPPPSSACAPTTSARSTVGCGPGCRH